MFVFDNFVFFEGGLLFLIWLLIKFCVDLVVDWIDKEIFEFCVDLVVNWEREFEFVFKVCEFVVVFLRFFFVSVLWIILGSIVVNWFWIVCEIIFVVLFFLEIIDLFWDDLGFFLIIWILVFEEFLFVVVIF